MMTKLSVQAEQAKVIDTFRRPGIRERPIFINFDLWRFLQAATRLIMLLRTVSWLTVIGGLAGRLSCALWWQGNGATDPGDAR